MAYAPPDRRQGPNPLRATFSGREISGRLHILNNDGYFGISIVIFPEATFCIAPRPRRFSRNPISQPSKTVLATLPLNIHYFVGLTQILAPRSDEMKKMLSIRCQEALERSEDLWEDIFNRKWAIVTLDSLGGRKDNPMH